MSYVDICSFWSVLIAACVCVCVRVFSDFFLSWGLFAVTGPAVVGDHPLNRPRFCIGLLMFVGVRGPHAG